VSERALVVGAGIVGLATAVSLAERGFEPLVLEAERRVASHQTGLNSGVIHSGLYYRPGSHKARLCTAGREALYRLCEAEGIVHRRCGKVVVAVEDEEVRRLDELERRGRENGLAGLERIDRAALDERFGDRDGGGRGRVAGIDGLWVPQTGIVDYRAVVAALRRRLEAAGGTVRTGAPVTAIRQSGNAVGVIAGGERHDGAVLVNCAGLQSDRVARLAGLQPDVRIVPFRGEYYELAGSARAAVSVPIYPVPDPRFPFLEVHLTPLIHGGAEAGPNAVLALHRHGYTRGTISLRDLAETFAWPGFWKLAATHWRFGVREMARSRSERLFVASVQRLMPGLGRGDFRRGGAGVRAQALDREGRLIDDFRFAEAERQVHVLNAPSPAATAALAIGEEIAERAAAHVDT